MPAIMWFRQDLRVSDNHALTQAAKHGEIIPVFVIDPEDREPGGASKWWLHHSLDALANSLGGLVLLHGDPLTEILALIEKTGASAVFWNRSYEPHPIARDAELKETLREKGVEAESFKGSVLHEPWTVKTGAGDPYKVFSPFWKALQAKGFPLPLPPAKPEIADLTGLGLPLHSLGLLPRNPDWAKGWDGLWQPGEAGAQAGLNRFLEQGLQGYGKLRDRPDLPNVSRLSPHLHFGEISPLQAFHAAQAAADHNIGLGKDAHKFQSEIAWRDFANHLLFHFPKMVENNWKSAFDAYPWRSSPEDLQRWQQGRTGYPMVDAGMRELWHTGYMHNRVRMLTASFLVKHLRIHWREGESWFWDTLLDADLANNVASWQWVTGSGADAAPYFRIFNPLTQGTKFDPDGDYVRKWCPELARLPNEFLHAPHEAPMLVLREAGIELGRDYPEPIVDHKQAREAALAGYEHVKSGGIEPPNPSPALVPAR